jgi:hypothetical protein
LVDQGKWHVRADKLVLNFRGDTRPADARYVEFTLARPDNDHFTIRQANALETYP